MTNIEKKDNEIHKFALKDEFKRKNYLSVIFVKSDKYPGLKNGKKLSYKTKQKKTSQIITKLKRKVTVECFYFQNIKEGYF